MQAALRDPLSNSKPLIKAKKETEFIVAYQAEMGRIRKEILKTPTPLTTMNVWMYLLSIMDFGGEIDCRIHTVAVMADETGIRRNNFTTSVNHLREIGALRVEKNSEARNAKFRSLYIM